MPQIPFNALKYLKRFEPAFPPIHWWLFNEGSGTTVADAIGGNTITLSGTPSWDGNAVVFNGSTQYGQVAVDLSAFGSISVSFWLWWDAFANDDSLAMEYRANFNPRGFLVDPSSGAPHSGAFQIAEANAATATHADFPRPSAAAWHHYVMLFDISVNPNTLVVYVDTVLQALSNYTQDTNTSTFDNSTLNIMSRNGTSLFGAGKMTSVRIYDYLISANQVAQIYQAGRP